MLEQGFGTPNLSISLRGAVCCCRMSDVTYALSSHPDGRKNSLVPIGTSVIPVTFFRSECIRLGEKLG